MQTSAECSAELRPTVVC